MPQPEFGLVVGFGLPGTLGQDKGCRRRSWARDMQLLLELPEVRNCSEVAKAETRNT
jgi:hypothetical protein